MDFESPPFVTHVASLIAREAILLLWTLSPLTPSERSPSCCHPKAYYCLRGNTVVVDFLASPIARRQCLCCGLRVPPFVTHEAPPIAQDAILLLWVGQRPPLPGGAAPYVVDFESSIFVPDDVSPLAQWQCICCGLLVPHFLSPTWQCAPIACGDAYIVDFEFPIFCHP